MVNRVLIIKKQHHQFAYKDTQFMLVIFLY